jgi:hypothetical protein
MTDHDDVDLLLAAGCDALKALRVEPSVLLADQLLFALVTAGRTPKAPLATYSSLAEAFGLTADDRRALSGIFAQWYGEMGLPLAHRWAQRVTDMPIGLHVLGVGDGASDDQDGAVLEWQARELVVPACEHRDMLEACRALGDASMPSAAADLMDGAFAARLLRFVALNDVRLAVAHGMQPPLAEVAWWWTALARLEPDALLQYALGELRLSTPDQASFDGHLRADPELQAFLADFGRDVARVRGLEQEQATKPWWQLLVSPVDLGEWARSQFQVLQRVVAIGPDQMQPAFAVANMPVLGEPDRAWTVSLMPYLSSFGLEDHFSAIDLRFVTDTQTRVLLRMAPRGALAQPPMRIEFTVELSDKVGRSLGALRCEPGGTSSRPLLLRRLDPDTFAGTLRISIRQLPRGDFDGDE